MGVFNTALLGFFESGGVPESFVYYFVFAACGFGLDVFDDHFAVFLAFQQAVDISLDLFFGRLFSVSASVPEETVQFVVKAFG